jgi:phenylpropionate dioxygenase-like ring-hydroxylating dioxygenase large terminal subunit
MASWLGLLRQPADPEGDAPTRALPASWYHSPAMYQLERRAIFSKKWILVTHKLRFQETGQYVQITEAGFRFFLIKDRQGSINAFHNVCRHRAYPILEQDCGKVSILACKYHGSLYDSVPRLDSLAYGLRMVVRDERKTGKGA